MRIHLDTDIGGDTDDACALALLLGWPDVELVAVTTVHDPTGRRAGYVHHLLDCAGRSDVPVGSGSAPSLTSGAFPGDLTLAPLAVTMRAQLRRPHLPHLWCNVFVSVNLPPAEAEVVAVELTNAQADLIRELIPHLAA